MRSADNDADVWGQLESALRALESSEPNKTVADRKTPVPVRRTRPKTVR